jgi:glyoxylase-like metal-dependent hydrolase (beta-lactamase superfamily II)
VSLAISVALVAALGASGIAQQNRGAAADNEVHVLPVQGNVYMLAGPDSNSAVQIGDEGVVVVDTMNAASAEKLAAAIRALSPKPVIQILNTSADPDHTGGNAVVAKGGQPSASSGGADRGAGAPILAHENMEARMTAESGKYKADPSLWPTETYFEHRRGYLRNGEGIEILFQANAHTDGDSLVFFRRSDVIVAGDIFTPQRYPVFDADAGGSINGLLAGLNHILNITITGKNEEGGTYVIPGRGHLCDEADVSDYRDMVTIVRDRIQDAVNKKMTLEQVRAAKLTRDYDGIYAMPDYTGDMFAEAAYKSLSAAAAKPAAGGPAKAPAAKTPPKK